MQSESDLGATLIGASYLDACLGALLKQRFRPGKTSSRLLDPSAGALGSFQARIDASYALALIDKTELEDLRRIGRIRNIVAHDHLPQGFSSPEVSELCDALRLADRDYRHGPMAILARLAGPPSPRIRYLYAVVELYGRLLLAALRLQSPANGA